MKDDISKIISTLINCSPKEIHNIERIQEGMTNKSYSFELNNQRYICRLPGKGTDRMINRYNECTSYKQLEGKHISDEVVFFDKNYGYKISKYIENGRNCRKDSIGDVKACMKLLRTFHSCKIQVSYEFDLFKNIAFYKQLYSKESKYCDYEETERNVLSLKDYIESIHFEKCLTHNDAVPDNFVLDSSNNVYLIDWEYSGMQDPHVDIAMFCIYSMYNKEQIDRTIDIYFGGGCSKTTRIKIYCYISICGLLWSNWCEYKKSVGEEIDDEYALAQYSYAKEYYSLVKKIIC